MVRLRRRDPEAIGLFYDRYGKAAYDLALRVLNDPALAESAVSEAMLKCWNRIASFKETRGCALGIWLLTTTYGNALGQRRGLSAKAIDHLPGVQILERGELFQGWANNVNSESVQNVFFSFRGLDAEEARLLDLAFFEGLNPAELSARLGRPQADIDMLIQSAMAKLGAED